MIGRLLLLMLFMLGAPLARAHDSKHTPKQVLPVAAGFILKRLLPENVNLTDQSGQSRALYSQLIKGRTAVVSFVFTGCSSTCPLISRKLQEVQAQMPERMGQDVVFISISVDPLNDTPDVLARYAKSYEAARGWSFLTGEVEAIESVVKSFNGSNGPPEAHTNRIFILNDAAGAWTSLDAISATPTQITQRVRMAADLGLTRAQSAERYFSNLPLLNASGSTVQFYRDVLKQKTSVIAAVYTRCTDACPLIMQKLSAAQALLPPATQAGVQFVGLSTDPSYDQPAILQSYSKRFKLDNRWTLLSGKSDNVAWILYKLGLDGSSSTDHSTQILIGNERSGKWQRIPPTVTPAQLAAAIISSTREGSMP